MRNPESQAFLGSAVRLLSTRSRSRMEWGYSRFRPQSKNLQGRRQVLKFSAILIGRNNIYMQKHSSTAIPLCADTIPGHLFASFLLIEISKLCLVLCHGIYSKNPTSPEPPTRPTTTTDVYWYTDHVSSSIGLYSTSPRNRNRVNRNHLEICLSSSQEK